MWQVVCEKEINLRPVWETDINSTYYEILRTVGSCVFLNMLWKDRNTLNLSNDRSRNELGKNPERNCESKECFKSKNLAHILKLSSETDGADFL